MHNNNSVCAFVDRRYSTGWRSQAKEEINQTNKMKQTNKQCFIHITSIAKACCQLRTYYFKKLNREHGVEPVTMCALLSQTCPSSVNVSPGWMHRNQKADTWALRLVPCFARAGHIWYCGACIFLIFDMLFEMFTLLIFIDFCIQNCMIIGYVNNTFYLVKNSRMYFS